MKLTRLIPVLVLYFMALLFCGCSPRLVYSEDGQCYWDFKPIIQKRSYYDVHGIEIPRSEARKLQRITEVNNAIYREANFLLGSKQGRLMVYNEGHLSFVNTYILYVKGEKVSRRCIKVKINQDYLFLDLPSESIIYSWSREYRFFDKYHLGFHKINKSTYELRITELNGDNTSLNAATIIPDNSKQCVEVTIE